MAFLDFESVLRRAVWVSLTLPACGGALTISDPAPNTETASAGDAAAPRSPAPADAATALDAAAPDAAPALDAEADAGDGCVVVEVGNPGGAACSPMRLICTSMPADCAGVCTRAIGPSSAYCTGPDAGGGNVAVACYYGCGGRRHADFDLAPRAPLGSVGAFFANLAELEAAAVFAFGVVREELVAHDAPRELVAAAERAQVDEVRHARIMHALAMRAGHRPRPAPPPKARRVRDLETMATENAIEGCVRETFGAAVAMAQAARATDPVIARVMRRVAMDETRHAAFAWKTKAWLASRLDADASARVDGAMRDAIDALAGEAALEPSADVRAQAGYPSAREGARLFDALRASLWVA